MAQFDLAMRAERNAALLRRLNIGTLSVAIVIYTGLLGIAVSQRIGPMAIFASCIMLAETLVFQLVRTLCDHLELVRKLPHPGN